ncbi:AC4 protein [Clerodendrum golden mosaic Jiangsu virus]|uniref:AC4 protein n=1 Tax=Clerodendrum golden mosaic Jiangsu virus TaxID=649509 RepID=C5J9I8_9GEMI|nr:AC4 protein [Clerodendrum golden mosaic Jiangsu virus]CAZ40067.1 AC4 protein [Clerodendrum golden mosaic Jiangsu virus]
MGALISMCLCNSRENTTAQITDSSTWYPQPGQHISIRTFRELNPAPTSSPISTRMEIHSNGENFKSTAEVLEEAARMLTTHVRKH